MNEKYHSLMENDTWDLVPLPKGRKLVRCKWVYRTKYASDGSVERHKARLVAKGFSQVEGIDYNETFAPIEKLNSIRLVLALAASHKWDVHQMDVKSSFLHGDLQEVQDPKYHLPLKNDTLHSLLYPNLDDLNLLQMFLDQESQKLDSEEKRIAGIMNVLNIDMKDHRQDHQLLLGLNGPI